MIDTLEKHDLERLAEQNPKVDVGQIIEFLEVEKELALDNLDMVDFAIDLPYMTPMQKRSDKNGFRAYSDQIFIR